MINVINLSEIQVFKKIVDKGNIATYLDLNMDEVLLTDISTNTDPSIKEEFKCIIKAKPGSKVYTGQTPYFFNKSSLDGWMGLVDEFSLIVKDSHDITSSDQILTRIKDIYGLLLTTDDIPSTPITITGGKTKIVLPVNTGSTLYKGNLNVILYDQNYDLNIIVKNKDLGVYKYPGKESTGTGVSGVIYTLNLDFTKYKDLLTTMAVGGDVTKLIPALKDITGHPWDMSGKFNLTGSSVVYSGATDTTDYPTNEAKFNKVVIVSLNNVNSTIVNGMLLLQYNA